MYKLEDKILDKCGNKAMFLSMLDAKGYNIPLGIVIDFEEFKKVVREQELDFETINNLRIPDYIIDEIFKVIPENKRCVVRTSPKIIDYSPLGLGEYVNFLSVAREKQSLKDKIKEAFLSLYSEENLRHYKRNNVDIGKVEMNIIVQEMIESNVSGVLFTVNPTNGKDTEIVIEFSKGAGDTVSGKIIPERIVYDWEKQIYIEEPKINLLGESSIKKIINIALSLQQELGFPIDLEFGVYDSKLYIFKLNPITKIEFSDIYYRYSNSNLENINNLSPLMLSLDLDVFDSTQKRFSKIITNISDDNILEPVIFTRFSRLYWNLTFLKKIFENVPGYVERYLDEKLKLRIDYLDNGNENLQENKKIKLFNKKDILSILKRQVVNTQEYRNTKIDALEKENENLTDKIRENVKIYMDCKSMFVWQQLKNAVFKINLNQKFNNILTRNEIQNLLVGIDNKYANAPFLYMWDMSRKIRADKDKIKFFEDNLDAEIFYMYRKNPENENVKEILTDFISQYGYHSSDESDIIYTTYSDEILKVIKMYRDMIDLDDIYDPLSDLKMQNKLYEASIQKLEKELKPNQLKNALKEIEYVRELDKDEFAFYDLSLIARYKLRESLLKLAKKYKDEYIIEKEEDIFFLRYEDILNVDIVDELKKLVAKNKIYYNSFRNYTPESDIFPCSKQQFKIDYRKKLKGIGASFGKVTARACVINSKEDIKNLKKDDVIVTSYLDKEIFENINLSQISGIITEFGGMLCHFAVKARENRVPCVVSLQDATKIIRTGETLVINGDTGEVIL